MKDTDSEKKSIVLKYGLKNITIIIRTFNTHFELILCLSFPINK